MSETLALERQPRPAGITADNYRAINKGSVLASVDLTIPAWHLKLSGCLLMHKDGREWVTLPTKPFTNREGKTVYQKLDTLPFVLMMVQSMAWDG